MAQSGNRVLLVDTDLRRPRLHKAFGVSNESGVTNVIMGEAKLSEVVKTTAVPNLFVMPCGPIPPNPTELFHAKAFLEFMKEAASSFDRVILDSPPVNAVSDPLVLSTAVDGVMFVIRAGSTNRSLALRALRSLRAVKARILGAVLNDVDVGNPRFGYSYAYTRYGYGDPNEAA